ncbi:hypothetical protein D3C85_1675490 [compost metagenome]
MLRARLSNDRWGVYAHRILDRAARGSFVKGNHVEWALAYLGDIAGSTKVPTDLQTGHRNHSTEAACLKART